MIVRSPYWEISPKKFFNALKKYFRREYLTYQSHKTVHCIQGKVLGYFLRVRFFNEMTHARETKGFPANTSF